MALFEMGSTDQAIMARLKALIMSFNVIYLLLHIP